MANTKGTEMRNQKRDCKCISCSFSEQDTYGNTYKTLICKNPGVWKRCLGWTEEFRSAGAVNRLKVTPKWCPKLNKNS